MGKECTSFVHALIHKVYEYEHMPRSRKYGMGMDECERWQIACFTHPLWQKSSKCACSICNHIWFYDEEMHEHFVSYFEDKKCRGAIPTEMDQMQFCHFMNQTERTIQPKACDKETDVDQKEMPQKAPSEIRDYISSTSSTSHLLYTNHGIIIFTVFLAVTMSLSMYLWLH